LDTADRGFSYRNDGPLDMRMDARQALDAATVVNTYPTDDLARLIAEYSDERYAGRVARAIERDRPITSTKRLAEVVRDAIPVPARREGGHPARRTFQAIRLEVNQELPVLRTALEAVLRRLLPAGRCVVLSYHSGEDRITKELFRSWSEPSPQPAGLPVEPAPPPARLVHRGVVVPSAEEQAANPRASSARLRALEITTGRRADA
jgi:16S rRNA (cytosine1402-N4)-methyltransferase